MASNNFINECKNRANGNRLGKIIVDGVNTPITNSDNLQSFSIDSGCYVDGNIIGSVYSKCLKANFITSIDNLSNKSIQAQIGVKYANLSTEHVNMGKYTVERPNNEITANMSQITAYDDLYTNLDKPYVCGIDYSSGDKTVSDLYVDVCNQLGLTPKTTTFINSNIPISNNPFTNGEKNRTVLQTVAKVSCSFIDIDVDNNKIDLCWLSSTLNYTFKKNDYVSVEGGQVVCGPINCLIIKNSVIDDENITIKDDASITQNGENSIIISEDYILHNAELRNQAKTAIWNRVKGMKYVDCKLTTYYGKPFLKLGNKIRIYTSETEYFDTYVLKHNFTYDGTFTSVIESPALTEQEIKTKQNIGLKEKLYKTQIDIDKQNKKIEALVSEVDENSESIANLEMKSDEIALSVSNKADKTYVDTKLKQSDSISGELPLHYENSAGKDLIEFEIEGNSKQETTQGYNLFNGDFRTGNSANLNDKTRLFSTQVLYLKAGTYKATTNLDTTKYQFQHYTFSTTANPTAPVANILFTLGGWSTNKQCIINITEELEGYYYMLIKKIDNSELTPEDMKEYQFMLKAGIDEKPYEPYTNGASPNPEYPQEIEVVEGIENLFDGIFRQGNQSNVNASNYVMNLNNIKLLKGKTYTLTNNLNTLYKFAITLNTTSYPTSNANFFDTGWLLTNSKTFTPEQDCYIAILVSKREPSAFTPDDLKEFNFMLEKGSVAHPYVPFGNYLVVKNVGENLFNKNDLQELYAYTDSNTQKIEYNDVNRTFYIKCDANSNYIVSKIRSAQFNVAWTKNKPKIGEPIYNLKLANYIQVHNGRDYLKINTGEDAKYLVVRYFQGAQDTTITKQEILDSIMIEKVDESTELPSEYKPYEEKISYINLNKSNLFDGVLVLGTLDLDGQFVNVNYRLCSENFIYVKSSSTYFIKNNKYDGLIVICYYDENKNLISRNTFTQSDKKVQFTTSSTTKYIKFCNDGVSTTPKNDLSTIYEIYEGYEPNYFIGKVGDIKDRLYLQNGHAYIDKRIGKVIIDGGQGIGKEADKHFYFTKNDFARLMDYTNSIISDKYVSVKNQAGLITGISGYASNTAYLNQNWIYIYDEAKKDMTTAEFQEYLKTNPVEVYYVLATLEIIDLGEVSISTLKGTNNLFIESNLEPSNCSIKYYLDTELNEIFTTHEEAHAMIKVTQNEIQNQLNKKVSNEDFTEVIEEVNNSITQKITDSENSIKLEVKNEIKTTVKSITPYYAVSTSNTTAPTNGWSTTVPTRTTNQFIWRKDLITYQSGTTEYTTPYMITGDKGNNGTNGVAGTSFKTFTTNYSYNQADIDKYSANTYSGTWAVNEDTIGLKVGDTVNLRLTNSSKSGYCFILGTVTAVSSKNITMKSIGNIDKGTTGTTGTGIASITAEFYLSTSKTTQTGGSWVTTMPSWSKGKYLWTRNKIVYKNPTSTTYTSAVCDSSYDAVNEVEAQLELKVGKDENDQIVSMLNASANEITFKSNRFSMQSTYSKIDKDGSAEFTKGKIGGFTMNSTQFKSDINGIYDYNYFDKNLLSMALNDKIYADSHFINVFDFNDNGNIDNIDFIRIEKILNKTNENTKKISGTFEINSSNSKNCLSIKDANGNIVTSLGLGGINSTYIDCNNFVCGYIGTTTSDFTGATINGKTGNITCASLTQTSLESQKKDFEKFTNALEEIEKTDIYKYHLKHEKETDKKHLGFVIGDKYNYSKEITSTDDKGNDVGVDTYSMISLCLQAIKELNTKVNLLESKIKELEGGE